jgi:hypothetical protein
MVGSSIDCFLNVVGFYLNPNPCYFYQNTNPYYVHLNPSPSPIYEKGALIFLLNFNLSLGIYLDNKYKAFLGNVLSGIEFHLSSAGSLHAPSASYFDIAQYITYLGNVLSGI